MTKRSITIKRRGGQFSIDDSAHLQTIADLNGKISHLEKYIDELREENLKILVDYYRIDQILNEMGLGIVRSLTGEVYIRKGMDFDPDKLIFPPYNSDDRKLVKERNRYMVVWSLLTVLALAFALFVATTVFHNVP